MSLARYIVPFVCQLTSSLGPMACDLLTSFVAHTLRGPSISRPTPSAAVQVKCAESSRLPLSSDSPPPFPNLHSSLDRVESPANHQRKCKYGTQQVQLKVKFSFNSFLQNPANRQQDKKQADSSRLIFIIRACSGREQGLVVTGVYSVCRLNLKIAQRSSERFRQ